MHTEHLQNVRPSWVGFGWFVSVAVASLILVALNAVGLLVEGSPGTGPWTLSALVAGFALGGYFVGARVGAAPILHGVAMGLFSIVVWLAANLVGEALDAETWDEISPALYAGGLLVQMAAAAAGARIGSRGRRAALTRPR